MKLKRFAGNPILSPHPDHPWEDLAVFNPAAWYNEEKREVL
ncbi:MAG: glycosidase, partial [Phycisphaerae bacterium]|nr:glycosidase [Phycisphaerae bacterium]